jgi:hypothetical protein
MPRVQAEYQQRVAAPQAVSAPLIQAEQFSADPGASSAFQLAHALGVADTRPLMNSLQEDSKAREEAAARAYANSMTIDELGQKIKGGEMLPSQSPVYVATVQHFYGENSMNQIENKMASELTSGELKLNSPEEVDKYLTAARNDHLSGQSPYTIAGFDKGWNKLRESMITANTRVQDKEYTAHGVATATESLTNLATKDATGTIEEQAGNFIGTYQMLRGNHVLMTPEASKEALRGSLSAAANAGNKDLVDAILASKLDNGETVSGVIGVEHGIALSNHADQKVKQVANQRVDTEIRPFLMSAGRGLLDTKKFEEYVATNKKFITTSTYHHIVSTNDRAIELLRKQNATAAFQAQVVQSDQDARRAIGAALSTGTLSQLPQQKVIGRDGSLEDAKQVEIAQEILEQHTQGMSPEERLGVYSRNNVPDTALKTRLLGGLANLATVGWKYDGKNIGEVSPVGTAAFDEFIKVNKVNPDYAKNLVGEKAYATLSEIEFMNVKGGAGGVKEAARVVNEANQSGITHEDFDKNYKVSVNAAVNAVIFPGFWSGTQAWWHGLFGNETPNLTVIHGLIRKHTELLIRSGVEPGIAVETSVKYLADPSRSTKINNTLYPNSALPQVSQGEQIGTWMERYKKEIPQKISEDLQVESKNIVLMPQSTGAFIAMNGGLPVHDKDGYTIQFTKEEFQQWVSTTMKREAQWVAMEANPRKKIDAANHKLFKARLEREMIKQLPKDSLPGAGEGMRNGVLNTVGSWESHARFLKEGVADKPVNDLKKIHSGWNPQPEGWQPFSE